MPEQPNEAFVRRQAQWDAFHGWESSRDHAPISLAHRIAWYFAAANRIFASSRQPCSQDIEMKVKEVQQLRARLAHLKRGGTPPK